MQRQLNARDCNEGQTSSTSQEHCGERERRDRENDGNGKQREGERRGLVTAACWTAVFKLGSFSSYLSYSDAREHYSYHHEDKFPRNTQKA